MSRKKTGGQGPIPESCDPDANIVRFIYSFDRRQLTGDASSSTRSKAKPGKAAHAVRELCDGNRKYAGFIEQCKRSEEPVPVGVELTPKEIGHRPQGADFPPQLPFAAVLGCVDARAPIELLFSQGFDDLYVMRIAGNSLGPDCSGSLHYAIHSFAALIPEHAPPSGSRAASPSAPAEKPLRLVATLGHSDCGAVTAAVKTLLGEDGYRLDVNAGEFLTDDSVRGLLGRINVPAVRLALQALPPGTFGHSDDDHKLYLKSLIELSVYLNAAWNAHDAQAVVAQYRIEPARKVDVRYGVFSPRDFFVRSIDGYRFDDDGKELLPPHHLGDFLSSPPASLRELDELAQAMATELKRQHTTDSGKELLGRYFGLR
jgi:carbonic anhydrase